MLSMRQIEVFRAVMVAGTVTEAARLLNVSQPAISRLLRYTEDQLGVELFVRQGGRLSPTEEAWTFYTRTERLFGELDDVRRAASELHRFSARRLHVAAIPVLAYGVLPKVVVGFRSRYPDVSVSIETRFTYETAKLVADNKVDVGLIFGPQEFPHVVSENLFDSEIVCVAAADNPITRKPRVSWSDLAGQTLVTLRRTLPIGAMIDDAIRQLDPASVMVEVTESSIACAIVGAGGGVAIVDNLSAAFNRPLNLAWRPFEPCIPLSIRMLTSPTRRPSSLTDSFITHLREVARENAPQLL